ncbi:MAG TPA: chemotaxis protein CheW [Polyangia bacterium]|nr:chemotaxis protein CheW [Polyangia bacterium]
MSDVHVLCKVADAEYLLPADHVLQMETFSGATKVPGAMGPVAGLVQIRGRVVPVLDLRVVFGFEPIPPTLDSRVVVMQQAKRTVGLLVDSAREVVTIPATDFRPPPAVVTDQTEGFVKAVAQKGNRLLMLIDFTKVIGEEHVHE